MTVTGVLKAFFVLWCAIYKNTWWNRPVLEVAMRTFSSVGLVVMITVSAWSSLVSQNGTERLIAALIVFYMASMAFIVLPYLMYMIDRGQRPERIAKLHASMQPA